MNAKRTCRLFRIVLHDRTRRVIRTSGAVIYQLFLLTVCLCVMNGYRNELRDDSRRKTRCEKNLCRRMNKRSLIVKCLRSQVYNEAHGRLEQTAISTSTMADDSTYRQCDRRLQHKSDTISGTKFAVRTARVLSVEPGQSPTLNCAACRLTLGYGPRWQDPQS